MKSASPLRSPGTATPLSSATSATSSQVHSERSESEQSRESTASPQPMAPLVTEPSLPRQSITGATPAIKPNQELITNEERSASPASIQEQLSPAVPQSYSYTPFSDSVTSGLAMPQVNGETVDELAHDKTIVGDKGEQATPSVPEEQDTSRSTLVAEEEEEEEREEGEGEEEREQQHGAVAASAERVEDEEDKPLEDISVKTGSISEHISEFSSEAEEEEEEEGVVGVDKTMPPLEMEAQDGRGVSPSDQYSDSFEEPSSPPSSQAPPLGELTPPLEPLDEATAAEDKPHPSDKGSEPAEQSEEEQVDVLDSLDGQADEEIDYQIGQRVIVGNKMTGTVRYVGHTHFAEGVWVGVEIDLPRGRNDGSIDGQKYFNCEQNYGLFAPPEKISLFEGEGRAAEEEEEEEGQPPFNEEEEESSVVEDLEVEEQLSSEPEEGDGEEYGDEDQVHLEVDAPPQSPLPQRESPSPVDDGYSPDFESSYEEEEEEEEREMKESGEGEKDEEEREDGRLKKEEAVGQHKEEYQWPTSREGTHEPSPLDEESQTLDKEATPPAARKDQGDLERDEKEEERKMQLSDMGKIVVQVTDEVPNKKSEEKTSQITEHPPPAKEMLETLGEKSESFPQAPEVANQRSQSATPTPAPPPEFAEGASKETSKEPPPPVSQVSGEIAPTLKQTSEVISEELAQELTNEAYETMHNIWKVKRELATKGEVSSEGETATILQGPLDKDVKLSLKDKADKVADQLLMVLLQSETNIARNIHNFKKSQKEESQDTVEEEILSPTSRMHSLQLPRSPIAKESERPVLSPVPEEAPDDDQDEGEEKKVVLEEETVTPPLSPTRRGSPAKLTLTGMGNVIESSPPPLSPPSPYRLSPFVPSFTPAADEFSPPGSPPKHLSQASAARVAAGDKTPFMSSQDKERKSMERSTSSESITSLLDSLKIKTAQCMVPSERTNINEVVKRSWEVCEEIGFDRIHSHSPCCPSEVLDMFSDLHELSPEESHCRKAYLELVFNLTVETLQSLHCASEDSPIWTHESAVRALLAPEHKNGGKVTVEKVQKKVYKALMRGQLPSQLPAVKFLRGMKRPGGREIDFVDTILIKELREEEPGWIDYCGDEASVKMKTADAILDSLITETVQIMSEISRNRVSRQSTQS